MFSHYLDIYIYQVMLEAKASEQSARMVPMKNATDNANSLIRDLTLEYNKLRQGNITRELLEIASGPIGEWIGSGIRSHEQRQNCSSDRPGGGHEIPETVPAIYNALDGRITRYRSEPIQT